MAFLNRDEILNCSKLRSEVVQVPEWGGQVLVIEMTGKSRDMFELSTTGDNFENSRAKLAACTVADEEGNLLFTQADILKLGDKSASALDRVFAVALKLNTMGKKDVEDLAKN